MISLDQSAVKRRNLLQAIGCSALLAGCAAPRHLSISDRTRLQLPPVKVAEDRIIRTVVGLRPYRPGGFVVRAEPFGSKTLVHNYGHGGAGLTLSWGTSEMAVAAGFRGDRESYAVLGCGAVGLATARLLQRRGAAVTLYAKALPPDTTSNIAGGKWWPTHLFDPAHANPPFLAQLGAAARFSYREFQNLLGPLYGVTWRRNYRLSDTPIPPGGLAAEGNPLAGLLPELRDLQSDEHPFDAPYVRQSTNMMIEPAVYLRTLMEDVREAGGRIVVRGFQTAADVAVLPESVVFNCTGLGARDLFGDPDLVPLKGQLTILLPQPEIDYVAENSACHMFPRQDGILLGGTREMGVWDMAPDPEAQARILAGARTLFDGMRRKRRDA